MTHKDMHFIDVKVHSFLGDQQHFAKQEKSSLFLDSLHSECPFQNKFSKPTQVWTLPVHQLALDFLE